MLNETDIHAVLGWAGALVERGEAPIGEPVLRIADPAIPPPDRAAEIAAISWQPRWGRPGDYPSGALPDELRAALVGWRLAIGPDWVARVTCDPVPAPEREGNGKEAPPDPDSEGGAPDPEPPNEENRP